MQWATNCVGRVILLFNSLWAASGGLWVCPSHHGIVSTWAYGVYRPRKEGDVDSRFHPMNWSFGSAPYSTGGASGSF